MLVASLAWPQNQTNMIELQSLIPNIMVGDVNASMDYYTKVLGFTAVDTNPAEGNLEWGYVKRGEVGLMFQEVSSIKTEYPSLSALSVGGALTLYIRLKNIEAFYESLEGKVKIIKALNTTFYGAKEFALEDINGFILTFSEIETSN